MGMFLMCLFWFVYEDLFRFKKKKVRFLCLFVVGLFLLLLVFGCFCIKLFGGTLRVLRKVSTCRFGLKDRAIAVRQLLSLSCFSCFWEIYSSTMARVLKTKRMLMLLFLLLLLVLLLLFGYFSRKYNRGNLRFENCSIYGVFVGAVCVAADDAVDSFWFCSHVLLSVPSFLFSDSAEEEFI